MLRKNHLLKNNRFLASILLVPFFLFQLNLVLAQEVPQTTAKVYGYVFYDSENNGGVWRLNSEDDLLEGVKVLLKDAVSGNVVAEQTTLYTGRPGFSTQGINALGTSTQGYYAFQNVPAGEYTIEIDQAQIDNRTGAFAKIDSQAQISHTTGTSGQHITVNSNGTFLNQWGQPFTRQMGLHWDKNAVNGKIYGYVFYDSENNGGVWKPNTQDQLLNGVTLQLKKAEDGTLVTEQNTIYGPGTGFSNKGLYSFENVRPGNYLLQVKSTQINNQEGPFAAASGNQITDTTATSSQLIRVMATGVLRTQWSQTHTKQIGFFWQQNPPLPEPTVDSEIVSIRQAFESIRSNTTFPVQGKTIEDIEDTFGPRIKTSITNYDWHRGIDVDAALGTPVVAAADGELLKVDNFPASGGLTVFIKHRFNPSVSYQGKNLQYYYTVYMHLDSVTQDLLDADANNQHPVIQKGQQIGTVGHSGATVDHLHFELRVGTYCSLEYQLNNPNSSCAKNFMFDPHMHPMFLFQPLASSMQLTRSGAIPSKNQDMIVTFTSPDEQPLLNRIEFQLINVSQGQVTKSHILDFNKRTGYDASTNALLDTRDLTKPYMDPIDFTDQSLNYQTKVVIPQVFLADTAGTKAVVTVTDIWGNTQSISWDY